MNETRRQYLLALAGSGMAGMAGCSGGGTDTPTGGTEASTETAQSTEEETDTSTPTEDDDSGSQQSMAVPQWASWIPANLLGSDGSDVVAVDAQQVRSEFPSSSTWYGSIDQFSDSYGVDVADMMDMLQLDGGGNSVRVVTGTFDPGSVRSHLGFSASDTDSYRDFTVIDDSVAVGESAIVQGQYRTVLDTRFGSTAALGTTDDWTPLLSTLTDEGVATAQPGYDGDASFSTDPLRYGYGISAGTDGGSVFTAQYLFASESQASTVYDRDQETLSRQFGSNGRTVQRLEQQGRRIVVATEQDTFDF